GLPAPGAAGEGGSPGGGAGGGGEGEAHARDARVGGGGHQGGRRDRGDGAGVGGRGPVLDDAAPLSRPEGGRAGQAREAHEEVLGPVGGWIGEHRDGDGPGRLAGSERERPQGGGVVTA